MNAEGSDSSRLVPSVDLITQHLGAVVLGVPLASSLNRCLPCALAFCCEALSLNLTMPEFNTPQLDLAKQFRELFLDGPPLAI